MSESDLRFETARFNLRSDKDTLDKNRFPQRTEHTCVVTQGKLIQIFK